MHISDNHCVHDRVKKDGENFKAGYLRLIDRGFLTLIDFVFWKTIESQASTYSTRKGRSASV